MLLIRGLKQNLLTLRKCAHQQKLVNISTIDAVKQCKVTFSNTMRTLCKEQADITTASSAGNVFQHHCVNED
jgi:hypothetical protein